MMNKAVCALVLCVALPASAEVISWRVDGFARTSAGPLGHFSDPVLVPLPDEPHAWQTFTYDTQAGFLAAAFDFGAFEGYAVGPITGGVVGGDPADGGRPDGVPVGGFVRADWITPYGLISDRPFEIGSGFGSHVAGGQWVLVYNFTATDITRIQAVPEPASMALVLLGLISLPLVRRSR